MRKKELEDLFSQYKNRKNRIDSDCNVVDRVWILYKHSDEKKFRRRAITWLLLRLEDKSTNELVLAKVCRNLLDEQFALSPKHKRRFAKVIRRMPSNVFNKLRPSVRTDLKPLR